MTDVKDRIETEIENGARGDIWRGFLMGFPDLFKLPTISNDEPGNLKKSWGVDTSVINDGIWFDNLPVQEIEYDSQGQSVKKNNRGNAICGDLNFGTSLGELGAVVAAPVVYGAEYFLAQGYENFEDADMISGLQKFRTVQRFKRNPEDWAMWLTFLDMLNPSGGDGYTDKEEPEKPIAYPTPHKPYDSTSKPNPYDSTSKPNPYISKQSPYSSRPSPYSSINYDKDGIIVTDLPDYNVITELYDRICRYIKTKKDTTNNDY